MTEVKDLVSIAADLNHESDSLQETLNILEGKLAALNIGIEVWMRGYEDVFACEPGEEYRHTVRNVEASYYPACILGYSKSSGEWGIRVATAHVRMLEAGEAQEDFEDHELVLLMVNTQRSLLDAPRSIRMEAVFKLSQLIDRLKAEAENTIEALREAKRLAELL